MKKEFEDLMLPHLDSLYAAALRYTRNDGEAQDLVQDTMLRAFRKYEQFSPGSNARAWLLRILTNTFINRYRRKTLERDVAEGVSAQPVGEGVMSRASLSALGAPGDLAFQGLIREEIERALATLPEDYRVLIVLVDIEGFSYNEAAEATGRPVGTIMSRLFRARRQLQKELVTLAKASGVLPEDPDEQPENEEPAQVLQPAGRHG